MDFNRAYGFLLKEFTYRAGATFCGPCASVKSEAHVLNLFWYIFNRVCNLGPNFLILGFGIELMLNPGFPGIVYYALNNLLKLVHTLRNLFEKLY